MPDPSDSHAGFGDDAALHSGAGGMRVLFIDFNAYFASVEQHDEPALRGRPVIVTPLKSEHSGAIAASYEAKALGISRGTSVLQARQICPDIAVRPARHDRYVAVHHLLMREIERHLPIARICSIDECACRLNPDEADVARARTKAEEIKRGIYANVGESLRCSIGLASSQLLAKLAGELHKPDGLTVIETHTLPDALADLPLRSIPGIGGGVEARLERAGITRFPQLWALAPKHARKIWGSVQGERFLYALHGHDVPEAAEPKKAMIGHSRVLSGEHRTPEGARIVARALLLKAASRLRHYDLYARSMSVTLKLVSGDALHHDTRFRATQNSWRFLGELDIFWKAMQPALAQRAQRMGLARPRIKLATVYLHGLGDRPPERDLFVPSAIDEKDANQARLWKAIDGINRDLGQPRVILASQRDLDLNYLGVKIAFSRVPDAAEFADIGGIEKILDGAKAHEHETRTMNPARALY